MSLSDLLTVLKEWNVFIAVLIGAGAAYLQLRHMAKAKSSEIFMSLWNKWHSPLMRDSQDAVLKAGPDLADKIDESHKRGDYEEFGKLTFLAEFFEQVGVLVGRGCLDRKMVKDYWYSTTIRYYKHYEPLIKRYERRQPTLYENFRKLKEKMERKSLLRRFPRLISRGRID